MLANRSLSLAWPLRAALFEYHWQVSGWLRRTEMAKPAGPPGGTPLITWLGEDDGDGGLLPGLVMRRVNVAARVSTSISKTTAQLESGQSIKTWLLSKWPRKRQEE